MIVRPKPLDGNIRGYVVEDLLSDKITWILETDDEQLACLLINTLFYGIVTGADVGRDQALRIRALDQWRPPFNKAN